MASLPGTVAPSQSRSPLSNSQSYSEMFNQPPVTDSPSNQATQSAVNRIFANQPSGGK